jgi:3-oxoadipate enol-lactonase
MMMDTQQACSKAYLAYQLDDFTDGWRDPEYVLLLHGIAESAQAFSGWVPHLSRTYRVIRPDLRGHGDSCRVGEDETLTIKQLADDVQHLMTHLGLSKVHVVGAKLGAQVALELAQRQPAWMTTLTLAGVLISPSGALGAWLPQWHRLVDEEGVEGWARATMPGRMGKALSEQGNDWWIRYMGETAATTAKACFRLIENMAEPAALESIACPTQVIAAIKPAQANSFSQQPPLSDVHRWVARLSQGKVVELEADSYHIAATHPDTCAMLTMAFIKEQSL